MEQQGAAPWRGEAAFGRKKEEMKADQLCEREESGSPIHILVKQLREITGIQDLPMLRAALKASQGDMSHAITLLTTQVPEEEAEPVDDPRRAWNSQKRVVEITSEGPKDDLQTAIELSLQESQNAQEEERELNRALVASVEENAAQAKRKRCETVGESANPADWIRQDDWPVGVRNVGNTCWFSAVIQSLFHLPVFRRLVLNYSLSERVLAKCKSCSDKRNIAFMQELRCLFALMVGSKRRFVDPSAAVELLKDAFRTSEAQQDVSEFTHKLLDWLEDAFQLAAPGNNPEDKQQNPMVQLFYGTFVAERTVEGRTVSNIEQFGQYPLQVNGFNNLDECLEGAMVEGEIESLHLDQTIPSGRERWFSKLPPVLTFELSRFEFNQSLGRPEKIHKKLEFPQVMYMDRYLHNNIAQMQGRREEVKKLKDQLTVLQQKLESYKSYGSGPTKYPLADMLQYVLEFATTTPTDTAPVEEACPSTARPSSHTDPMPDKPSLPDQEDPGPSDGLSYEGLTSPRSPIHKPLTPCSPLMDSPHPPAPHSISEEELYNVKNCLQRWRIEVENNVNELKSSIKKISQSLEDMYSDNCLCQVPYRLHAVLVHEGQASAGHYWAYVYDHGRQCWLKCNDVSVTESSWAELVRDSYGGMTNASAYCLMYIDDRLPHLIAEDTDDETGQVLQGMDALPPILRRYVWEDNCWFQQELQEWEEHLCRMSQEEPPQPSQHAAQELSLEQVAQIVKVDEKPGRESKEETEDEHGQEPEVEPEEEPREETVKEQVEEPVEPRREEPDKEPEPIHSHSAPSTPECEGTKEQTDEAGADAVDSSPSDKEQSLQSQSPEPEKKDEEEGVSQVEAVPKAEPAEEGHGEEAEQGTAQGDGNEAGPQPEPQPQVLPQEEPPAETSRRPTENQVSEVDIPNVGKILVHADADGYNEEVMLTPAMQGIILAIAKARHAYDKDGPEAGLIKAFHEEYSRLYQLSQEETTPQSDPRLQHVLVYFFQNQAPNRIIERTLLEQFADRNLSYDERSIGIMKEARAKLRLIRPEDMNMEEYMKWHEDYNLFRKVFVYLLTGLEQYQNGKVQEALNYLVYAFQNNAELLSQGERKGVDQQLIALYRRKCLTELNENAAKLFSSGDESNVAEGLSIMNDTVIPCMHLMIRDSISQEDLDVIEVMRSRWCSYLEQDMEGFLQEKLGEFLPRLLDCSVGRIEITEPPKVRPGVPHDLCSRLTAVMESIHGTSIVTVK